MATKRVVNIDVNSNAEEASKDFDKLNDSIEDVSKNVEESNEQLKSIDKSSKNAVSGIKSIGKSVKGLSLAFKSLGIGLIIAAFASLKEVFTQNQKVANALGAVFETISIVFNEVADVVTSVYESVSEATNGFDALGKVMGGILKIAIAPFKVAFFGIKLAVEEVQLAWEKSPFGSGDLTTINKLQEQIKITKKDLVDVGKEIIQAGGEIVTNFVEAAGEIGSFVSETVKGVSEISIKSAFEQGKAIVEAKNNAQIAAAQQGLLIEKYDQQAEKLRQIRDEERNTIEERTKANDQLNEVLDKQEKALLKQADAQIKSAKFEFDKNQSIENRVALIDAQANREGVLAQIEGLRSEQLANDLALDREKLDLVNAKLEAEELLSINEKRFLAERIQNEDERLTALIKVAEEERNLELQRLEEKRNLYKEGTQSRLDADIEYLARKQELNQNLILLEEERAKKTTDIDKKVQENRFNTAKDTFGALGGLANSFAGENEKQQKRAFEVNKAVNIATGLMDTYAAALSTFKNTAGGVVLKSIAAASAVALGLANVNNIRKQKFNSPSLASAPTASVPNLTSDNQQSAPSFNVVGASGISQTENLAPVKAYVVSGDVTTQQSLDRNRLQNATF